LKFVLKSKESAPLFLLIIVLKEMFMALTDYSKPSKRTNPVKEVGKAVVKTAKTAAKFLPGGAAGTAGKGAADAIKAAQISGALRRKFGSAVTEKELKKSKGGKY
jgi:hypothetical protein